MRSNATSSWWWVRASGLWCLALSCALCGSGAVAGQDSRVIASQARVLLQEGRTDEAEALLGPAVEEHREAADLQALLGTAQYLNRRYLAAEISLGKALAMGQREVRTRYYLCSTLWENGKLQAAEEVCRAGLTLHGQQVPLMHLLGRLYLWQGRFDEAVPWLEKAVARSPGSVDLWLDLAGALEGADRLPEALEAYGEAVVLAPAHYQVRYGRARVLRRVGDLDAARRELDLYQQLLLEDQEATRESGLLQARIEYGRQLLQRGRPQAAIDHLDSLPGQSEVLLVLAAAYLQLGDRAAGLRALEQAVAMSPERQDLRERLAAVRMSEGDEP